MAPFWRERGETSLFWYMCGLNELKSQYSTFIKSIFFSEAFILPILFSFVKCSCFQSRDTCTHGNGRGLQREPSSVWLLLRTVPHSKHEVLIILQKQRSQPCGWGRWNLNSCLTRSDFIFVHYNMKGTVPSSPQLVLQNGLSTNDQTHWWTPKDNLISAPYKAHPDCYSLGKL